MSTSDISKEVVYDPRIRQLPARFGIQEGALSVTSAPFVAVSKTTSQHQYNINAPSLQVFIDRAMKWTSTFKFQFQVAAGAGALLNEPIFALGQDGALCAFPLNSLVGTMTANINDSSVTFQSDQVLKEVLRMANCKKDRLQRTCPTMLDKYVTYSSLPQAVNNPIKGYADATDYDNVPNGAFWNVRYVYPENAVDGGGNPLTPGAPVTVAYTVGAVVHNAPAAAGGPPRCSAAGALTYTVALEVTSTEKLVLPPFIFADDHEFDIGLTGINNIQVSMAMSGNGIKRVIRNCINARGTTNTRVIQQTSIQYLTSVDAFGESRIDVVFLTPNLSLDLPAKSVVPYATFDRYITSFNSTLADGATEVLPSTTVTLPGLPDKLIIYCKPRSYIPSEGDYYLPISRITANVNNFSGLLSSMRAPDLYAMSVKNGLEMDWNAWNGKGRDGATGNLVPLVGGFLVLALGQDLALQAGEAPGLQGQVTVQFDVTVANTSGAPVVNYDLFMIPVYSGFLESLAGSSRIIKNILSPDDIVNASVAPEGSVQGLQRITGGGFFDTLGSALSKGMELYSKTKPLISAAKGLLPDEGKLGTVKNVLGKVGYGRAGAGMAGAGGAGAGLSKRLL